VEDWFAGVEPPVARFTSTLDLMTVSVDATDSSDSDGTVVSYAWDWDDGSPVEEFTIPTATHTDEEELSYTITLTVKDNDGLLGEASVVVEPHGIALAAVFTVSVDGLQVDVNASASNTQYHTIVAYEWNFGDTVGVTNVTETATHKYTMQGTYWITLTVTDDKGDMATSSQQVEVSPGGQPPAPFNVVGNLYDSEGLPVLGATTVVTDMRTGFTWTFADTELGGYYLVDLNTNTSAWEFGDMISVTATLGELSGTVSDMAGSQGDAILALDVVMTSQP
jgi:PKD repeat protein